MPSAHDNLESLDDVLSHKSAAESHTGYEDISSFTRMDGGIQLHQMLLSPANCGGYNLMTFGTDVNEDGTSESDIEEEDALPRTNCILDLAPYAFVDEGGTCRVKFNEVVPPPAKCGGYDLMLADHGLRDDAVSVSDSDEDDVLPRTHCILDLPPYTFIDKEAWVRALRE